MDIEYDTIELCRKTTYCTLTIKYMYAIFFIESYTSTTRKTYLCICILQQLPDKKPK